MDFITVCFERDYPQMLLQARSMSRFLADFPVDRIIIILNGNEGMDYLKNTVLDAYGDLKSHVVIAHHSEICEANILPCDHCKRENPGCTYCYQQLCKISASKLATSDKICVLDAKNWINRPWKLDEIEDKDGRMKLVLDSSGGTDWIEHRKNSWEYYGLTVPERFPVVMLTPFFAYKDVMQSIAYDKNLIGIWNKIQMGEFFLIEAATRKLKGSVLSVYWFGTSMTSTVWQFCFENDKLRKHIKNRISPNYALATGMHRFCYKLLNDDEINLLCESYTSLGLMTYEESIDLINWMKLLNK